MTPLRAGLTVSLLCLAASCSETKADDHGVVKIELREATGQADPFAGTTEILVNVTYDECLRSFYTETHTQWAQSGVDGGPVFEEWVDRLCDPDDAGNAAVAGCEVVEIEQNLGASGSELNLRVRYAINDADLALRVLRVGPLPVESLTEDCTPQVTIDAGSVLGFNAENQVIWNVQTFTSFNTASTNQSGELWVAVAASEDGMP